MDLDFDWYPQAQVCSATMAMQAAQWMYHQRTEKKPFHDGTFLADEPGKPHWSAKRTERFPFHRDDGVSIFVAAKELNMGVEVLTGKPFEPPSGDLDDDL